MTNQLPPEVQQDEHGAFYRTKLRENPTDGSSYEERRPVALTLDEARKNFWDYWHPKLGWIIEGLTTERNLTAEEVMEDRSSSITSRRPETDSTDFRPASKEND